MFRVKQKAKAVKATQAEREEEEKRQREAQGKRRKERRMQTRKLQKRTRNGQPLMKYSVERILGQIDKMVRSEAKG